MPSWILFNVVQAYKADTNKDGKIVLSEWREYLRRFGNNFLDQGVAGGVLRVLAYAPAYSCNPPTLFLICMTAAQITCYLLRSALVLKASS